VQSSANIASISHSAASQNEPLHIQGANLSAQALFLARYIETIGNSSQKQRIFVVLCPNLDLANEFASNLECLNSLLIRKPVKFSVLPTWDQSPFHSITPSIRTRLSRLEVLQSLIESKGETPHVIITTLAASCQTTLPRNVFQKNSILLKVDDSLGTREALMSRLIESGYFRVDTVEDPGTFAARGEIVDVFAPNLDRPIRIELFGDQIERIRYFDPNTQRTLNKENEAIQKISLAPAREVLINALTSTHLREELKKRSDDQGIPRIIRDPILASVQNSSYPDHCDAWAPFAYEKPESLWDYVGDAQIIWIHELSCIEEWETFQQEQNRLSEEAVRASLILPEFSSLYIWNSLLEADVRKKTRFFFDQVQLSNIETLEKGTQNYHQVLVVPNTELKQGSKNSLENLEPKLRLWQKQGFKIIALASTQSQVDRIRFLFGERNLSCFTEIGNLSEGFQWPAEGLVILTEEEILGTPHKRKQKRSSVRPETESELEEANSSAKSWSNLQTLSDLSVGDAVVHVDHGIGRYHGLVRLNLSGAPSDFLLLEYANKDKLYLPVYRLNVVQKYIGSNEGLTLDRLGTQQFNKTKDKVREAVKKLAIDLIRLYAERKLRPGIRFSPPDSLYQEFEAQFPFEETPDQLKAIRDSLRDLESGRSMDRLVCGDVGYGKTEVAIRAAFRAVCEGKQVAVLVPTTVLAFQHEQSFKARMKDYPIQVESISRFKTSKEQKAILENLATGKIDIIIGTHRLLSNQVKFQDLGLVIVDEEHRFGVEHKERLKTIKINTHVLTLTATPIPRTLHMALSGLRDISLINTPPVDRLPIRTYVSRFDEPLIQRAILSELNRGGQVFFLHNRVQSIYEMAQTIRELVPSATVSVAHGQMSEKELEEAMIGFYQKRSNVLVCTTIIESGLDVPSANTIIINRADTLGLAQLYQTRGRVGRSESRAYAYLLIPDEGAVTHDAKRRLEVIQKFVELGSGFHIASHDLEIRGGGDLLGAQQSGNINAVGFDLYMELLEEAIHELQGKLPSLEETAREPEIKTPFPAFLSEEFVPDIHQRLSLYRRFSATTRESEITALEEELRDRFGALPVEAQNLIWLIRLKQLLKHNGIESLTVGPEKISMLPGAKSGLNPASAIALVASKPDRYQLLPDSRFVAKLETGTLRELLFGMEKLLKDLRAGELKSTRRVHDRK